MRHVPQWFRALLALAVYFAVERLTRSAGGISLAALVLLNVGEVRLLNNYFNKLAPSNKTLRLFKSNTTPAETDTAATYTEADFTGYAAVAIPASDWTVTGGNPTAAVAPQKDFTSSANQTAQTVFGNYVTDDSDGVAQWAERFGGTSPVIQNTGDKIQVTPRFEAE